jgi:hypothetical protein
MKKSVLLLLLLLLLLVLCVYDVEPKEQRDDEKVPGLFLWAFGRTSTGSFSRTLQTAVATSLCNDGKEGFAGKEALTSGALLRCAEVARQQKAQVLFTHLKPWHIAQAAQIEPRKDDVDPTPLYSEDLLFRAAKRAGFRTVVGIFRENQLALSVSATRLNLGNKIGRENAHVRGLAQLMTALNRPGASAVAQFDRKRLQYMRGLAAARRHGLNVLTSGFDEATRDMCSLVRNALALTMGDGAWSECPCEVHIDHMRAEALNRTGVPDRERFKYRQLDTLEHTAVRRVRSELTGTKYEWMLDLHQEQPPSDAHQTMKQIVERRFKKW